MSKKKQRASASEKQPCDADRDVAEECGKGPLTPKAVAGLREELDSAKAEIARLRAELAQAEANHRESNERLQTVLEQSVDIAYRRNLKTDRYDYLSPAIETITGYTVEEFSRIRSSDLLGHIHPEDHAVVLKRFEKFEQSRHGAKVGGLFEYRLRRKDGEYRWMSDSGVLVSAADGTPLYHVGLARDVTERKRMEEALERSNEELEDAVDERTVRLRRLAAELALAEQRERKRLSEFLHDDLQQVLVAAKFACEKLVADHPDSPLREDARRLCEMLMDALGKTRSAGKALVNPLLSVMGLVPALRYLADLMCQMYGLRVEVDALDTAGVLPESVSLELYSSVRELFLNVVKHAGTDMVTVRVRQSDGRVDVSVFDGGNGFDQGTVLSDNGSDKGYGLYRIGERMTAMGGRISIESTPGYGTKVTLSVPVFQEQAPAPLSPLHEAEQSDTQVQMDGRARVLVADDHDVVRNSVVALLAGEQMLAVVGEAADGREAVDLAQRLRPDIVVMDIRMPKMDGIQATRLIKEAFPETVVIGMSAFCEKGFRTAMLDVGVAELLDKADADHTLVPTIVRCLAARDNRSLF